MLLAGRGGGVDDGAQTETPQSEAPQTDAFPVTIDTAYGEITVEEKPERIVALGIGQVELLGRLDEDPIEFAQYLSDGEALVAESPWAEGLFTGEPNPALFTAEFKPSAEAIAALEPDLILTDIWQMDDQLYGQLSDIAPTYAGLEEAWWTDWDDNLTALAALTRQSDAVVAQVQGELDAELADAATRLPGLEGKTVSVVRYSQGEFVFGPQGVAELEALGMQPAEGQPTTLADDSQSFSRENVEDLQADVVIIAVLGDPEGQAELEADPRVAELPAAQNGSLFYFDATMAGAINQVSPASLRWWLEEFVPQLEASPLNAGE